MLRGDEAFQHAEADRLADWLHLEARPNVVVFSNMLMAGCARDLKRRLNVPIVVTLQGDDIFLADLVKPFRAQAFDEIRRLDQAIDGYIVPSRYYADHMASYLGLPREKFHIVPLGLDTTTFSPVAAERLSSAAAQRPPRIGYLARLAPEKGLHVLSEAFGILRGMSGMHDAELWIAGWSGPSQRKYIASALAKLRQNGGMERVRWLGEVDRRQKLDLLRSIDVLSVPTVYREPKGLFVLEALAAGVPVVQPEHGSFPEILEELGGGLLHRPEDPQHLAERLHELLSDPPRLRELGRIGREGVEGRRSAQAMAQRTVDVLRAFVAGPAGLANSAAPTLPENKLTT